MLKRIDLINLLFEFEFSFLEIRSFRIRMGKINFDSKTEDEPCYKFAEPPQPPSDCSLHNETTTSSLEVNCVPGADGGTPQYFLLQVRGIPRDGPVQATLHAPQSDQGTVGGGGEAPPVYQERNPRPNFQIRGLEPGFDYTLYVYAVNGQGRSEPALLENVRVGGGIGEKVERDGLFLEDLKKALPESSPENMIIVVALTGTGN